MMVHISELMFYKVYKIDKRYRSLLGRRSFMIMKLGSRIYVSWFL